MSDQSHGGGWWEASDGKWYPPPRPGVGAQPTTQPLAGEPPQKSGLGRGPIIGIAVAALLIVGAAAFFLTRDNGTKDSGSASRSDQTDRSDQSDQSDQTDQSDHTDKTRIVPSGFKVIGDDASDVSIAVPTDYDEIDPSQFLDSSSQSAFSGENPDLAPFLSSGNTFLQHAVLSASGSVDGTPAVVVVGKSPQRIDPTDSEFASELQSELETQLAAAGDSQTLVDTVELPAGTALRVRVTLEINTASSSGTVHETIFFVTVGRMTWVVLGVSVGDPLGELFGQIAQTFAVSS